MGKNTYLLLLCLLIGCAMPAEDIHAALESCIPSQAYNPDFTEQCFYEVMSDVEPGQVVTACDSLFKEGEYDYRIPCFSVLISRYHSEDVLSQILKLCEFGPPRCKIEILGFFGDESKCEILKKDFNITVEGKPVFSFYDKCVDLARFSDGRQAISDAVMQRDISLCPTESISKNVCLFRIAERTLNADLCDSITLLSEDSFTFRDYCKCNVENKVGGVPEPVVVCMNFGNPFEPHYTEECEVKQGRDTINKTTVDVEEIRDFKMKFAPCTTSWSYSGEKFEYSGVPFWTELY